MGLIDFFREIDNEISSINSTNFGVEITDTDFVPNVDDQGITYDNIENQSKKCKRLETCVLYIDIRKSTQISLSHKSVTLTKLYSAFVRSMVKAAGYHNGYVRNIIGDRVMVVFDRKDCFKNAISTAILFNTISVFTLNKYFKYDEVEFGIGIDYGKMLITKTGTVKQGIENQFYKSLVWLGRPANIASKLTDSANKIIPTLNKPSLNELLPKPSINSIKYTPKTLKPQMLQQNYKSLSLLNPFEKIKEPRFQSLSAINLFSKVKIKPILITKEVLEGLKKEAPELFNELKFTRQNITINGYLGEVFGTDYYFTDINKI